MNKVHQLDENSIRQIAAGEVVERPASAVKELIENAIDAGSRRITLEIEEGGKRLIRISDDGCGMLPEDAALALERHTTSKIQSAADLESLSTFGFRGEALPSIASISKLQLATRSAENDLGVSLALEGSKIASQKECGRSVGTTVEVKELFFNTPARLKFLKSDATEKNKILRTFEEIAIAHPQIAFETQFEGRKSHAFPARKETIERINDLWGNDFSDSTLIPVSFQHPFLQITGWISKPESHQAAKSYQIFYVNQRPIVSRIIAHALYESYRDCLPVGRHPVAVLFFRLDPSQVDVNVHPAKREVRFRSEHQIYESLVREIRLKRSQQSAAPVFFSSKDSVLSNGGAGTFPSVTLGFQSSQENHFTPAPANFVRPSGAMPSQQSGTNVTPPFENKTPSSLIDARVLAQFHALYILVEQGENLLVVDQHAAAERVLYEKFRKALLDQQTMPTQPLLFPLLWNVSISQAALIKNCSEPLRQLGFIFEPFGEKTFRISEAPALIAESELKNVMDEILAALENDKQPTLAIEEKIMHSACRAAIKANDTLSPKELSHLLDELSKCSNPHTCPHGRPITLTIPRQELDRKFGRTY